MERQNNNSIFNSAVVTHLLHMSKCGFLSQGLKTTANGTCARVLQNSGFQGLFMFCHCTINRIFQLLLPVSSSEILSLIRVNQLPSASALFQLNLSNCPSTNCLRATTTIYQDHSLAMLMHLVGRLLNFLNIWPNAASNKCILWIWQSCRVNYWLVTWASWIETLILVKAISSFAKQGLLFH